MHHPNDIGPPPHLVGTRLGSFHVETFVDTQQGVLRYVGGHMYSGQGVLIKCLAPQLIRAPQQYTQFFDTQARATGFRWPTIAPLLHYGEIDHHLYSITPLYPGETLTAPPYATQPTWATIAKWARSLASALDTAHAYGLVHGALRPEAVWIDEQQNLYVMDFGFPCPVPCAYAPPEHDEAAPPAFSADHFGLAMLVLHILAGRLDLPTPDHFASGEHRALAGTPFEAALHPQPARRYANASTFVDDLLDWLAEITSEIAWPLPHEMPPEPPGTTEQEWVWSPLLQPRLGNKQTLYHNKENTRVSSCIWLNDQDTFLSAGEDGFIYRWGLGEPEPTFVAATDVPILSLAISQDGWHLATGHADGSVRVWQQDGLLLHELAPHTGPVYACSLAANGQILATGGADGTLRVWDLRAERQLTVFRTYTGAIRCCTLNPSGSLVLFGGDDQRLQLGGVANGDILQTFKGHLQAVLGCDLRGELAFSGDAGGNLYAWDILLEDPPLALREHRGAVADCHIYEGADGSVYGLSCATDGQVCTWDLRTGTLREVARPFPQEAVSLTACALNARARVVGTADGRLHIQARGGQVLAARRTGQHTSGIVAVAAHDNDAYAIGYDSRLTHSRRADGALQAVFALEAIPTVLAIDADYIYAGDQEGRLRCYDRHRGRLRWEAKAHRGAVTFILAEPADAIITGGADGVLAQWKKQDGARLSARSVAPVGLHCAALQDDTRLLAGTQSGDVLRINFRSGHSLEPVLALGQPIRAILRFGPMWFAGTSDGYLQALNTDAEHTGWRLHASGLQALAIIPGPKWLSSLSPQGELAVWDMAAQRCLHRWQPGPLFGAMASAGHHQLLLGDEAGHLHLLYWGPTHG